ncbi:CysS/YqeB C-terminal domain-containing protein [Streptosporangium soli]|nr:hypothetical protein [Streptosporangium sp. KLBMP 9127]
MGDRPGILVLMGSGETSPTMVEIHRSVVHRLGGGPRAVLLDTPYAFQENAADISARARRYFAHSVGLTVTAGSDVGTADWVFSGPGSPTYALDRWNETEVAGDLRARIRARAGATVLASAAACTAGLATVPVYEIYKVGAEPHWREGLDLLGVLGLRAVVIPHYDNAEGGTHDTRFCYLGERRLSRMERDLPPDAAVLGIDEHTAVVTDLLTGEIRVSGRGGLTVRRAGSQAVLPAGTVLDLARLRSLIEGRTLDAAPEPPPATPMSQITLAEVTGACGRRFEEAMGAGDTEAATQAVLDLEGNITKWAADTEEDEGGVDQAREVLRRLISGLGRLADPRDPRDRLAPLVEPLLTVRSHLREQGRYGAADALREALLAGGVVVEDTPHGPRWTLAACQ